MSKQFGGSYGSLTRHSEVAAQHLTPDPRASAACRDRTYHGLIYRQPTPPGVLVGMQTDLFNVPRFYSTNYHYPLAGHGGLPFQSG